MFQQFFAKNCDIRHSKNKFNNVEIFVQIVYNVGQKTMGSVFDMEKIKEKLSIPRVQVILFALLTLCSLIFIIMTVKSDKEHNTPDMTDTRAVATVMSVTSYSAEENGIVMEYSDVIVNFSINDRIYNNISIYKVPFHVEIGDHLSIKYDKDYPNICSVVDDPKPRYSIFAYIFWTAVMVFGIFGLLLAIRRVKLKEISENVAAKNATQEEIDRVKEGYIGEDGVVGQSIALSDDKIDYNKEYDVNKGVMDSYFDPFATYSDYGEESNHF